MNHDSRGRLMVPPILVRREVVSGLWVLWITFRGVWCFGNHEGEFTVESDRAVVVKLGQMAVDNKIKHLAEEGPVSLYRSRSDFGVTLHFMWDARRILMSRL